MADIIRDAPLGQVIRYVTSGRYLKYAEERPGFVLPTPLGQETEVKQTTAEVEEERRSSESSSEDSSSESEIDIDLERATTRDLRPYFSRTSRAEAVGPKRTVSRPIQPTVTSDGIILVDWYCTGEKHCFEVDFRACR